MRDDRYGARTNLEPSTNSGPRFPDPMTLTPGKKQCPPARDERYRTRDLLCRKLADRSRGGPLPASVRRRWHAAAAGSTGHRQRRCTVIAPIVSAGTNPPSTNALGVPSRSRPRADHAAGAPITPPISRIALAAPDTWPASSGRTALISTFATTFTQLRPSRRRRPRRPRPRLRVLEAPKQQ